MSRYKVVIWPGERETLYYVLDTVTDTCMGTYSSAARHLDSAYMRATRHADDLTFTDRLNAGQVVQS